MDKRKTTLMGGSVLVLALVAVLGIVYAAYSQSLTINGTASVKANSWNIHFGYISKVKLIGEAQEITAPTIKNNSTEIGDYSVLLSKPGDSIEYETGVNNDGTFEAELSDVIISQPTCIGTGETAEEDAANVCKYLEYSITINHEETKYKFSYNNKPNFRNLFIGNDNYHEVTIKLTYLDNVPADELPKNDVAISNLGASLVYIQAQ